MKARATCWLKLGGRWIKAGETFEADEKELAAIGASAEVIEAPRTAPAEAQEEAAEPETPAKRSRRKK